MAPIPKSGTPEMKSDKIEKLKLKIRKLEEENFILNKIIFKAPIPIFVLDKDHKITHFNQALEELAELDGNAMRGTRDRSITGL